MILGANVMTGFLIRGRQEGRVRDDVTMEAEIKVTGLEHEPKNVASRSWKRQGMASPLDALEGTSPAQPLWTPTSRAVR